MFYEITFSDQINDVRYNDVRFATRKRKDAAINLASKWAYEGIKSAALLDRPIARQVLGNIAQWGGHGLLIVGDDRVGLTTIHKVYE